MFYTLKTQKETIVVTNSVTAYDKNALANRRIESRRDLIGHKEHILEHG